MKKYAFIVLLLLGQTWAASLAQLTPRVPSPSYRSAPLRLEKARLSKASRQLPVWPSHRMEGRHQDDLARY